MPVPETASDLHYRAVPGQHNIRPPGQIAAMQPEPESHAMKKTAYNNLWLGVFSLDPGHHCAAGLGIDDVCQLGCLRRGVNSSWSGLETNDLMCGAMARAIALTTGTATELPNCL